MSSSGILWSASREKFARRVAQGKKLPGGRRFPVFHLKRAGLQPMKACAKLSLAHEIMAGNKTGNGP
jgi:hypothetical protein